MRVSAAPIHKLYLNRTIVTSTQMTTEILDNLSDLTLRLTAY